MENLRRGVSDRHDGHAGWTVVPRTVLHVSIEGQLEKKLEILRNRVFDNQNGCAGRTVVKTTVRHMCPLGNTWEKNERPLETRSLTT